MRGRAAGFWVVLALALLAVGLLAGPGQRGGDPLDPDATNELGTAALVELLGDFGARVERGRLPDADTTAALVLVDRLTDTQRAEVAGWVDEGGVLVVADPGSAFSPVGGAPFPEAVAQPIADRLAAGRCDLPPLNGLVLEATTLLAFPPEPVPAEGSPSFEVDGSCFSLAGGDAYLQVWERGRGRIIALGGALPLTNRFLDDGDNAVLAVEVLTGAVSAGTGPAGPDGPEVTVVVLYEPVFEPGSRRLVDLVPSGLVLSAWQLAAAFAAYVWWRARRFGRPVPEPQPVELPASLLVRATGELRRRSGANAEVSAELRAHLERRLRRELKLPPELPATALVAEVSARTGLDPAVVGRALAGPPATSTADLTAIMADIDAVQAHLDTPTATAGDPL